MVNSVGILYTQPRRAGRPAVKSLYYLAWNTCGSHIALDSASLGGT